MMSNATLRYFKEASLIRRWKSLERENVSDGEGGGEYSSGSHLVSVLSCKTWRYYLSHLPSQLGYLK